MSTNFHTVIPQQSSQYHHLSSLKSYIHFHNFFTISTHHPHSPLTDFSHAFIHHSHTTGHIETPFRPSKQTSTRLCSRTIHIPTTTRRGLSSLCYSHSLFTNTPLQPPELPQSAHTSPYSPPQTPHRLPTFFPTCTPETNPTNK